MRKSTIRISESNGLEGTDRQLYMMKWLCSPGMSDIDVKCLLSRISKMSVRPLNRLTLHFLGRRSVTIVKSVELRLSRRIERIVCERVSIFDEYWLVVFLGIDTAYRPTIVHRSHLIAMCNGRNP